MNQTALARRMSHFPGHQQQGTFSLTEISRKEGLSPIPSSVNESFENVNNLHNTSSGSITNSMLDFMGFRKPALYQNTYRLAPTLGTPKIPIIKSTISQAIDLELTTFATKAYTPGMARHYCKNLAEISKQIAKQMVDARYKVVSVCLIGENNDQDMRYKINCLWNADFDREICILRKFRGNKEIPEVRIGRTLEDLEKEAEKNRVKLVPSVKNPNKKRVGFGQPKVIEPEVVDQKDDEFNDENEWFMIISLFFVYLD